MPCYHPVQLPVKHKPITPGGPSPYYERTLPCGTCLGCRANQARDWSIRILHETSMHSSAWFLTLTYSNEDLPKNGSLSPTHLSGFFKTLRRKQPPKTVSYYACGEYGERTERPHYHAVLYGVDFLDRALSRRSRGLPIWRSQTLEDYWPYGLSEFSTVTPGSAAYVAGYVRKKVSKRVNPDAYSRVDTDTGEIVEIHPEFSRMSLKPAIGKRWIEKNWPDVYPRDFVVIQGNLFSPPRYYDKWMDEHHPSIMAAVRAQRDSDAIYLEEEKLAAKEKIHSARTQLFQTRGKV